MVTEQEILEVLESSLPKQAFREVEKRKWRLGPGSYFAIVFAANSHRINGVMGQFPQIVSLCLDLEDMELSIQHYAGMGGRTISCIPDRENAAEKYLAIAGRRIPFRKPKSNKKAILSAIKRFAENWLKIMRENREVLMYQDVVDYDQLLLETQSD